MDLRAPSPSKIITSPSECGPNQAFVLLLNNVKESVARLHRQTDGEFLKCMRVLQHHLEKNGANLVIALSVTLKRLLEINNDIRPTQIFDLNDPSSFDTNYEHFRFLANNARDSSKKYLSLATRNLCPSFPDFVIWIKQESSYYNSLSLLYDAHASRLAFDANNTPGRTGTSTSEIDLHSQSLSEATQILTNRIGNARRDGQDHLHVITGRGSTLTIGNQS